MKSDSLITQVAVRPVWVCFQPAIFLASTNVPGNATRDTPNVLTTHHVAVQQLVDVAELDTVPTPTRFAVPSEERVPAGITVVAHLTALLRVVNAAVMGDTVLLATSV
jgi:hypothetical protein